MWLYYPLSCGYESGSSHRLLSGRARWADEKKVLKNSGSCEPIFYRTPRIKTSVSVFSWFYWCESIKNWLECDLPRAKTITLRESGFCKRWRLSLVFVPNRIVSHRRISSMIEARWRFGFKAHLFYTPIQRNSVSKCLVYCWRLIYWFNRSHHRFIVEPLLHRLPQLIYWPRWMNNWMARFTDCKSIFFANKGIWQTSFK